MDGWMWYQRIHDTEGWMESKDARCAGNTMHVGIERSRRTRQDTTGTSCHPPSTIPCRITCVASDPNVRRSVVCGTSLAPRRIGMRVCCARARAIQRRLDSRLVRTSTELERANRKKPRRGIHDTPHVRCFVTQDRSMPSNGRRRTSTCALIVRSCERAPKPRRAIAVDRTAPPRYTLSADTPANNRTPLAVHLLLLGATDRGQMHLRTPVRSVVFPFRVRVYLDRRGATASRTSHGSNVRHSSAFFVVMWRRLAPRLTSTCGVFEVRKAIERCTNVGTRGLPSNRRETRANGWSSGRATSTTRVVKRTADEGKRAELRHQSRCRSCR